MMQIDEETHYDLSTAGTVYRIIQYVSLPNPHPQVVCYISVDYDMIITTILVILSDSLVTISF